MSPHEIIESVIEEYECERHFGPEFQADEIMRRLDSYGYEIK